MMDLLSYTQCYMEQVRLACPVPQFLSRTPLPIPTERLAQRIVGVRYRRARRRRVGERMQHDEVVHRIG